MGVSELVIDVVVSEAFQENTYIVHTTDRDDCVVIDPGLDPSRILEFLTEQGLRPTSILLTHGHGDHIAGIGPIRAAYPDCEIVIGSEEAKKLLDPVQNLSDSFGFPFTTPPADRTVVEGDSFESAGVFWEVLDVPGHSAGHVAYVVRLDEAMHLFVGDVIFSGSIGRTDFPDGDFDELARSIRTKIYTRPDDAIIHSGHGPDTTVGREKAGNPFVRPEETP